MNAEFSYFWGIAVPGSIILFSLLITLWLYRMFAREHHGKERE